MRITLLCPGPSLARLADVPPADLTIGVNRAAIRYAVDVWAALDHWSVNDGGIRNWCGQVIGSPLLLSTRASLKVVAQRTPWRGPTFAVEDYRDWMPPTNPGRWTLFSATCALVYAGWRGATRIDVYGADMMGTQDYDGAQAGARRDEGRWKSERVIWATTVAQLNERGIEVIRHELQGPVSQ